MLLNTNVNKTQMCLMNKKQEQQTCESAAILRTVARGCHRGPRTWPPTSARSRNRIGELAQAEIRGHTT
jgi:hypothetical protein